MAGSALRLPEPKKHSRPRNGSRGSKYTLIPRLLDRTVGNSNPVAVQDLRSSMVDDLPETCMVHLVEIFERQYFSRCWCVQEAVASSWAIAKIEDLEVPFFDLTTCLIVLAGWKSENVFDRPYKLWKSHAELDRKAQELAAAFLVQMAEFGPSSRRRWNSEPLIERTSYRLLGPELQASTSHFDDHHQKFKSSMPSTEHSKMKILLIGKGGREHALAWKLTRSQSVEHVYVLPGNAGTEALAKASNCREVAVDNFDGLVGLSKSLGIDIVIIGPDDAVVGGMGDHFRNNGIRCFSPSQRAAIIEGSKDYAKDFMCRWKIPTALYETFDKVDCDKAKAYVRNLGRRVVIKVDGLAAGKGVILPETVQEAEKALEDVMLKDKFGDAGDKVIIEEYLEGYEISILTFTDGKSILSLPPGQDHKRIHDGDRGLNTGGMGVYAPVSSVTDEQMADIEETIILPTILGLELERRPFNGMLFTGIMMTPSGPKVLEYNARFGDPETQSMVLLLSDETLLEIILACVEERLADVKLDTSAEFACNITVAAEGYPESYRKGDFIRLGPTNERVHIFHAGTERINGELVTAGGRVFSVAATGKTLEDAVSAAYEGIESIYFEGMFYRKDIAARSLKLAPGRAEDGLN
ncbi:phosphoribosylamine-glycine ligase [Colletotrichum orchidophilum]|uniref:phosphoribosylamine--glycine ligase n=1 Tax=Colletotrichum orchidophilum TaxID=1209926 RepID=A0A1G4BEV2_9PEZI|nr:phosphoribosylamine-glycine ligase [Colletotrichum orchidophilum]OHE99974.1 phosphoribosylamine-glycine ligase [Colletotrichum orchidophilum]